MPLIRYVEDQKYGLLDKDFLEPLANNNYMCPVHHEPLIVRNGYKLLADRSLSLIKTEQHSDYPHAICWSRGLEPEKHGPIEPAPLVYCLTCQKEYEQQEKQESVLTNSLDSSTSQLDVQHYKIRS